MNTRKSGTFALALLTLIWSSNWLVMKLAMADSGPFTFSLLRYLGGTALLFVLLRLRGDALEPPPLGPTALIGLLQTAGFSILAQWALVRGGAGKTALLVYTMPFWSVLLARLTLGERLGAAQRAALAAGALGMVLVLRPWTLQADTVSCILAAASGLSWAGGTVVAKRMFLRTPVAPLRLTAWQMAFGTLFLVPAALLMPERATHWTPDLIAALAYNVILASGIGWTLWLVVVQRLPAGIAGLSSLAIPLLGVVEAWALLGERPDAIEVGGMAAIAAALLLLSAGALRRRPSPESAKRA